MAIIAWLLLRHTRQIDKDTLVLLWNVHLKQPLSMKFSSFRELNEKHDENKRDETSPVKLQQICNIYISEGNGRKGKSDRKSFCWAAIVVFTDCLKIRADWYVIEVLARARLHTWRKNSPRMPRARGEFRRGAPPRDDKASCNRTVHVAAALITRR